jgi:hypothetical protein
MFQKSRSHPSSAQRPAVLALYSGLVLSLVALIVLYVDRATGNVLAGHIRAGYPTYPQADIDAAARFYLVYLSVLGVLAVGCWLLTIWAVRAGKRWARWVASAIFLMATSVALTDLLIKDTSGDTGLAPLHGWLGLLPCAVGLVAVVLLWRRSDSVLQ